VKAVLKALTYSSQGAPIDPQAGALTHRAVAEIRRCLVGT
jgi:hypothetical protein